MLQPITEHAPAKLNLFLHITGKREDGYHCLDSLVAFTEFGDTLECYPDDILSLDIQGRFANSLEPNPSNLVFKAALALKAYTSCRQGARIVLHKEIPIGAGLGGGSSDAAATLRALTKLWNVSVAPEALHAIAAKLGSDVPVCLYQKPAFMRGIGEQVIPVELPTRAAVLLINPLVPVLAGDVYKKFREGFDTSPPLDAIDSFRALICELSERRNALTAPAVSLCPAIAEGLQLLRATEKCQLARMSGSGGTCFGLFETIHEAEIAAALLKETLPDWWMTVTTLA
jgi:4-diphosphocytidyl-2-C-methyl-D-erythritol kinase